MPVAKRKHRSNPQWLARHVSDPFVKAATADGYRSRAAYKLIEIDDRDKLLRPGQVVVDLGAAPGSWTQVVTRRLQLQSVVSQAQATPAEPSGLALNGQVKVQPSGKSSVIALDVLPMDAVAGADFVMGDFREDRVVNELRDHLGGRQINLVLSDMAPNLSGIAAVDAARCGDLYELALAFAVTHLVANGAFLVKVFHGSGYSQFVSALKRSFFEVASRKPTASRAESAETYLLARRPRR